jgi:hypothetical protein
LRGQQVKTLRGKLSGAAELGGVKLEGDESTMGVLHDPRLRGMEIAVIGEQISPDAFRIRPIHERALFVHKDGKRLFVTYWCEVCAIRTYTPGKCVCCQDDTALDLKEKLDSQ